MKAEIDDFDRRILAILQRDATCSVDEIADAVGRSRNACWRRIRIMEEAGVIRSRVALVDAAAVGCPLEVVMLVRITTHDAGWMERFQKVMQSIPEIMGAYRMTGDLDYLLRVRVADVQAYDGVYKRLIARIPVSDISASFVMEQIKDTTALPL